MRSAVKRGVVLGLGLMLLAACTGDRIVSSSPQPGSNAVQPRLVEIHATSLSGMPLDHTGINQLELCSARTCYPATLVSSGGRVKADDQGGAMLVARAEVPPVLLRSVKLYARGHVGVNASQVRLPKPIDLREASHLRAKLLLSLSANRSCTRFSCLTLRGAAGLVQQDEGHYVFYNPNADLRKTLPGAVALHIPRGALPDVQVLRVTVDEGGRQPSIEIEPPLEFRRHATVSLPGGGRNSQPQALEIQRTGRIVEGQAETGMSVQP